MQSDTLEGFRLSPQQKHLWSLQQAIQNQPYLRQCLLVLEGPLDTRILQKALRSVIARHEILRTSFRCLPGITTPLQFIADEPNFCFTEYDFSRMAQAQQEFEVEALMRKTRSCSLDFATDPLFSISLITLRADKHLLLLVASAFCADGPTCKNLMKETSRCYSACLDGHEDVDEPMQYADLSEWQHELLQEEDAEPELAYWRKLERSQVTAFHLPFRAGVEKQEPQQCKNFMPQTLDLPLEAASLPQITALARQHNSSPAALLLACWRILLTRFTGVSDLIIGVTCDGRHYEQLATALGPYARVVPLSVALEDEETFKDAVTRVESSLAKAVERQEYFTWEERDEQGEPFMPLSFEFEDWSSPNTGGELRFTVQRAYSCQDRFALKLSALQSEAQLRLTLHYDPDYLTAGQVNYLGDCLLVLLRDALARPQTSIDVLELLTAAEQQRLLRTYAPQTTSYSPQPLHQLFELQVAMCGKEVAAICGEERLTYQQLNSRANQLAHFLREQGVAANTLVALCLPRSLDLLIALLAVLKAGGAYAPLDPDHPAARLGWQLQDLAPRILLTHSSLLDQFADWHGPILCLDQASALLQKQPQHNLRLAVSQEDLAYIIYTSGSTGKPKGVMIPHRAVSNYTQALCAQLTVEAGWHFATVSTLAADLGNSAIFCSLASGGCLHILPYELLMSPHALNRYIQEHPLDVLKIVPSHLSALLSQEQGLLPRRFLLLGGEALSRGLLSRLAQADSRCCIINHYGPTETTIGAVTNVLGEAAVAARASDARSVPIGRPIPNLEAYILDKHQCLVPVGVVGELYLAGTGLALGYLERAEQTAERFVPHGFSKESGQRMYRTGDLACYREDGLIEFVGRRDEQVKLRGYRIELKEIEAVLETHPAIEEAVVLVQSKASEEQQLVAYVVPDRRFVLPADAQPRYRLPNGMSIAYHNSNEVDYQYQEIFEKQSYLQCGIRLPENACVFDVGANIGLFTLFVASRCPDARIYAFEPLAGIFETLRTNAELYAPRAKLLQIGLSDKETMEAFTFYPRYTMMSGLKAYANAEDEQELIKQILRNEQQDNTPEGELLVEQADVLLASRFESETQMASLRSLSVIIQEEDIEWVDLLKVDAQRAELDVLRGIRDEDWARIRQIVMEVHDAGEYEHEGRVQEILKLLESHGYTITVEQDPSLRGTDRYTLYAIKQGLALRGDGERQEIAATLALTELKMAAPSAAEIRAFLKEQLPEYMVPTEVIQLEKLPLTANGKVDRAKLPSLAPLAQEQVEDAEAARTPLEEVMVGVWQEVLNRKQVGRKGNFFHLGGHSLLGMKLVSRLRAVFGVEVPITWVFEAPTLAQLAARVEGLLRGEEQLQVSPIESAPRTGALPLSFAQQRLWFIDQLEPGSTAYLVPSVLPVSGPLHIQALEQSIQVAIRRHETLRTTFEERDGQPVQVIHPAEQAACFHLPLVDLEWLSTQTRQEEAQRFVSLERQRPFNLAHGPLLRACVLRLAPREHMILLTLHHIITDGWSNVILQRELRQLYQAFVSGESPSLPDLPVQYADYALWQRQWLQGTVLEAQLDYWMLQLSGASPLKLPTDYPRPAVPGRRGAFHVFNLSEELSQNLNALCQAHNVTLFMTLLAAFQVLLYRYTGQTDIMLGTDSANRNQVETENLIGFFINVLVLRVKLDEKPSFREVLRRVREVVLGAYMHNETPFDLLVRKLVPDHALDRMPLVQALFVLRNLTEPAVQSEAAQEEVTAEGVPTSTIDQEIAVKFDLAVFMQERAGRIHGSVNYSLDLFSTATIVMMMERFVALLQSVVQQPDVPIDQLNILTQAEQMQQEQEEKALREELPSLTGEWFDLPEGNFS